MANHHFEPQVYYNTLGTHPTAFKVAPGDRINTTTVDARGWNAAYEQVAVRGNPMTGPFFVEGAEPGDALVVHLETLRPNRPTGWTRAQIAANVVDPGFEPGFDDEVDLIDWAVDVERGTVRLDKPTKMLSALERPLEPMVGCFGVAPPGGQAISTATSSTHGGNMDYRGFVEGVTVYFPVAAPGGLFFLGDGHALQGDGEIVGTGIEISFDVTFTLDLVKGAQIGWPRAENESHIMTAGNARPLDQCVQHATSELVRWLEKGWGVDPRSTHILLGQCVEYDMGNVFDPAYTMVCKLSKEVLQQIGARRDGL